MTQTKPILILGSAPNVMQARDLPKSLFSAIVAINNAWQVRDDWDYHIAPDDFAPERMPPIVAEGQRLIRSGDYVPANNAYGGVVYAGGTMAFTAGYWALAALRPSAMVFFGCDMVYPAQGKGHFYGTGTADPLRDDVTLRSLEAKSARLVLLAAMQGCACVRAPVGESRLVCPAVTRGDLERGTLVPIPPNRTAIERAQAREAELGHFVESGRYWESDLPMRADDLDEVDGLWRDAFWGGALRASVA